MSKDSQGPLWEVFVQKKAGQPFVHCGSLHAYDKEMALENARDLYTRRSEGSALWVVPAAAIVASSPEDIGPFFEPANDKVYRHPTFYQIPEGVKYI
ncbi:MAG TPA: 1,2-phenylacetyl-CoA epoxidase subunit PaaB [Bacteroidia bacterium]|jgi:ring-1,2-phenylacetyl-CoA epoxidase subunit PaaB|nr:1,2-phenylacetyl-CoA epoxidase subunit PaaB [Bacteroidia bacterium]HXD92186.1 1,2-phenylacetyl-CoA epoxidase subunit PaaB [Bacteroidia bacterium]HXU28371.1 1,2-phenylacetyl-CoA epoxidase subunit PaaB [Bacteroidia bacterium]